MDWNDTPQQSAFRAEVRKLIGAELPERYRERDGDEWSDDRRSADVGARGAAEAWAEALAKRGWIAPHWPREYGGGGLTPIEQFIFNQETALAGAPRRVGGQGVSQFGPTLIIHGTPEQRSKHLPRILSGEQIWAQAFSEPGAGSDLASLQTRAIRDGDEYVINGQKIWTSSAHYADWLYVLVRTNPDAPKHRGISMLLVDKTSPGISVRPLIDMAWRHHFNETFFENVRVPAQNLVGEEDRGWYIGATLLDFERSNVAGAVLARRRLSQLVAYVTGGEGRERSRISRGSGESGSLRHQVAECYIDTEIQMQFSYRIISIQNAGQVPNYEASTAKLFGSELSQRLANLGVKVLGLYGQLWDENDDRAPLEAVYPQSYVISVSSTIAAGTSEIQRNIIATRGLGLPRA